MFYELHITGTQNIVEASRKLGIKTIEVDLIWPDGKVCDTHYMTAHEFELANHDDLQAYVDNLSDNLVRLGVDIHRVKVECPPVQTFFESALYIEHHSGDSSWAPKSVIKKRNNRHISYSWLHRCYHKPSFRHFADFYSELSEETELCLIDTYTDLDQLWLREWK